MNGTILLVLTVSTVALFAGCDGTETGGGGTFGGNGNWVASGGARSSSAGGAFSASGGARSTGGGGTASTGTISCSYKASTLSYCVTALGTAGDCVSDPAAGLTAQLVTSCPTGALLTCDLGTAAEPATAYFYDATTVDALEAAFPSDPCDGFTGG